MRRAAPAAAPRLPALSQHTLAYAGLILFTILLYLRPNDLLPIGTFPIVKIITIGALAAFFVERLAQRASVSIMPTPFRYLLILSGLVVLSIPIGLDPSASFTGFTDRYLKVLLVFLLMINVVTSFRRLRLMMQVTVLSATGVALLTLSDYVQGKNLVENYRAAGAVGGLLENPNDLALAMNVLIPIAFGLVLSRPSPFSKCLYAACTGLLAVTMVVTYSRAGLLTMAVAGAFFLVKLSRRYPALWGVAVPAAAAVLVFSRGRIFTLFDASGGHASAAESANMRWSLIMRSIEVAGANPIRWLFGVGMDNFHIVSHKELVSHNAYLQVFNEIGLPAMIFYVLFLASVIKIAGRITARYRTARGFRQVWLAATAIETSLVAYAVGSLFASVAFLWYVYYPAAFAVCLQQILARTARVPARREVTPRVWYLRRAQH